MIKIVTPLKKWGSFSSPVLCIADDGKKYIVKGAHLGKSVYNDYICPKLGDLLGAAVTKVIQIEMPSELHADEKLCHIPVGIALGSLEEFDAPHEYREIRHQNLTENRSRFASLLVLYTWCYPQDTQVLYSPTPPEIVLSHDHGHFFHIGPNWTESTLQSAPNPIKRAEFFNPCDLTDDEIKPFFDTLKSIRDTQIEEITNSAPKSWGVPQSDIGHLSTYLKKRRDSMTMQTWSTR